MSYITEIDILDESKDCFLTYAAEVLADRSIPAAADGLLSAQRKILWTMEDYLKMDSKSKTKKCNAIVGSTLSTSYFHGDQACYGVLSKMAQEYLMRYPLICGQGSLGTQENNDMIASSRYTEAKPSIYTDLMMENYKKNIVPTKETYNGEFMEPVVLPGLFPNAICNGRQAIGLSMSHCSAPHNLTEACNAIIKYIENNGITINELIEIMPGPDFPLPNTVINKNDIKEAYATGHSKVSLKVRGKYEIDNNTIIFTTIPYRTYRNKIKEQLEKNIEQFENILEDFNDESELGKNKLIFKIKKDASISTALNKLFKYTDLQSTVSYNMNYIVDGTPKMCSMIDLIKEYVKHQTGIIIKIAEYDKNKAESKAHLLEGLLKAIADIDLAIKIIRNSANKNEALIKLVETFDIDDIQANGILDMKLSKLTKLDSEDIKLDLLKQYSIIEENNQLIGNVEYRNDYLISLIKNMRDKYGDARRTELTQLDIPKEEKEVVYVEPEKCVVVMTEAGTIKRIPTSSFKTQKRNGKGVKTQEEITSMILRTNTVDNLMIFSDQGKMYRLLVDNIPVGTNVSRGSQIKALTAMEPNENPTMMYSIYRDTDAKYVFFATKNGLVKKTPLEEYVGTRKKTGLGAISFRDGDSLASVSLVKDEGILILTKNGYCIRFNSNDVSATGRLTYGVKGIGLNDGDYVVAAIPIRHAEDSLAIFTENGCGKKVALKEFALQKRGGKGVMAYKGESKIAAAALIEDSDNILIVGDKSSICVAATEISLQGRSTAGTLILKTGGVQTVSKV